MGDKSPAKREEDDELRLGEIAKSVLAMPHKPRSESTFGKPKEGESKKLGRPKKPAKT